MDLLYVLTDVAVCECISVLRSVCGAAAKSSVFDGVGDACSVSLNVTRQQITLPAINCYTVGIPGAAR